MRPVNYLSDMLQKIPNKLSRDEVMSALDECYDDIEKRVKPFFDIELKAQNAFEKSQTNRMIVKALKVNGITTSDDSARTATLRVIDSIIKQRSDFVKLAEAFHARGLRATDPKEVDDVIKEMIAIKGPVIADIVVDPEENCFPMITSGSAHNEMMLGPEHDRPNVSSEGMALV